MTSVGEYGPLLDALRGVHWRAQRRVAGAAAGLHQSRMRGAAPEFTEYRRYRQGDDPRRIDWRLMGRSDRVYIRLADDRSVMPTSIVLDASASMAFATPAFTKWLQARRIAVGLAAVTLGDGDPVGLVVSVSGQPVGLPARTRRGVLGEIARMVGALSPAGSPSLVPAMRRARGTTRLAIISDFLGDEEAVLREAGERLAAGSEVHAVHLVARQELEPPKRAMMATDPEDPAVLRPLVSEMLNEYASAFGEWREALAQRWRSTGAAYTMVTDDEAPEHAIRRIAAPLVASRVL